MVAPRTLFSLLALAGILALTGCEAGDEAPADQEETQTPDRIEDALPEGAQALSLLGEPLFPPELPQEARATREAQLAEALQALEADPEGADALIWAGRRYAYLGEYRKAIEVFSEGIAQHPEDARFYRHRGHRFISVREFDNAIADFERAAELIAGTEDEVEPDGQPNALGIPTSTLHFNIWYHFGLAHFVKGDFEAALPIYETCMEASIHPDSKVATAHWLYMTLRRLGHDEEARSFMAGLDLDALASDVIESGSYLDLLRLYKASEETEGTDTDTVYAESMDGAALGYGHGNFYLYNGRTDEARAVFEEIVAAKSQWAAFGYIAAEADLARLGAGNGP